MAKGGEHPRSPIPRDRYASPGGRAMLGDSTGSLVRRRPGEPKFSSQPCLLAPA